MAQIVHNSSAPIRSKLFETQPLHTKYDVIRAVLSRRAPALANYFAVPNVDPEGRQIVWSTATSTPSRPIPLSELPLQERASLLGKVQRLHDELCLFKEGIADTGEGRSLKSLLASLQDVPDGRHIYSVDGQPVFIYWSHEQEEPLAEIEYPRLERIGARRNAPPPPPAEPAVSTVPSAPASVARVREVVVANGVLVFVGAVSFFGITLASMCLAALSLYYLVTGGPPLHSKAAVIVISDQVS